jgi:hypothetical protein
MALSQAKRSGILNAGTHCEHCGTGPTCLICGRGMVPNFTGYCGTCDTFDVATLSIPVTHPKYTRIEACRPCWNAMRAASIRYAEIAQ